MVSQCGEPEWNLEGVAYNQEWACRHWTIYTKYSYAKDSNKLTVLTAELAAIFLESKMYSFLYLVCNAHTSLTVHATVQKVALWTLKIDCDTPLI